jgi:hypothetical protein
MVETVRKLKQVKYWLKFHVLLNQEILQEVYQELLNCFEARNPSNPAVVSEIDGVVSLEKSKRGNREIIIESKFGDIEST